MSNNLTHLEKLKIFLKNVENGTFLESRSKSDTYVTDSRPVNVTNGGGEKSPSSLDVAEDVTWLHSIHDKKQHIDQISRYEGFTLDELRSGLDPEDWESMRNNPDALACWAKLCKEKAQNVQKDIN